ncbi:sigma-70 family RNA polymerase sigma factor [Rhizobium sp. BK251]|uniref:RNA polymerase sigma factor n=1 Tax=Rhizobium sp. BK251 TaxID=2512125 RepID=UPI001043916C|nr:sigma-70 family RNA polymerase sigma factor [Rhizobium sp. BK251]TCL75987.1 RNA polymerase sigma-70 factor (ECF subfamily) [Rhizobium sp. BK251]
MSDLLQLVEPMIPALRRYARGLLRDAVAADDLVQDCLERVVAHWGRRRNDDPRTWVFAILHNLAVNRLRQTARRGEHLPFEKVDEVVLSGRPTQEDGLLRRDILDALDRLPEEQRSVLLLVSVEDLSYAQAAEVLAIPIGTVMSRLSRARERLRVILEGPEQASGRPGSHLRRVK